MRLQLCGAHAAAAAAGIAAAGTLTTAATVRADPEDTRVTRGTAWCPHRVAAAKTALAQIYGDGLHPPHDRLSPSLSTEEEAGVAAVCSASLRLGSNGCTRAVLTPPRWIPCQTGGSARYGEITAAGVDGLLDWIDHRLERAGLTKLSGGAGWAFVDLVITSLSLSLS